MGLHYFYLVASYMLLTGVPFYSVGVNMSELHYVFFLCNGSFSSAYTSLRQSYSGGSDNLFVGDSTEPKISQPHCYRV